MAAREMVVSSGATVSIGRALDNVVCLDGDPNISRYHAVIEGRGDDFWLSDLGSSNGTTIGNDAVSYERKLQEGDVIIVGGSSTIEVHLRADDRPVQTATQTGDQQSAVQHDMATAAAVSATPTAVVAPPASSPASASSSSAPVWLIGGIAIGVLLIVGLVALYAAGLIGGNCRPTVKIVSPQSGSAVRGAVRVRVETENAKCIERVIYQLDGNPVAKAEASPYDVTLSAGDLNVLGGGSHILTVTVEDDSGKKRLQPDEILLAFTNTGDGSKSTTNQMPDVPPTPVSSGDNNVLQPTSPPSGGIDVSGLARNLATQISRKSGYVFDPEFAAAIGARTLDYRLTGTTDKARRYRRDINKAFRDKGLEPLLGYAMALSRSKFNENAGGDGAGLWQIPPAIAQSYLGPNETAATALADSKRAADVTAAYMKDLFNTFETDDFMYAIACFGLPVSKAGEIRTKLMSVAPDPSARRDFWKMVKSGVIERDGADRVARFFAAGIVGENPQAFGLGAEQPFSSLY